MATPPNPNPARVTGAIWNLWTGFLAYHPTAKLGGVYAVKSGYHNYRDALQSTDYSVQLLADKRGPGNKASALDITLSDSAMRTHTKRLDVAARGRDPRLYTPAGPVLREFIGTLDSKTVYCYVLTGGVALGVRNAQGQLVNSGPDPGRDKSHLWHIHLSIIRQFCDNFIALDGVLSVLRGETLAAWRRRTEDDMSAADVQAIRGDLGRLAQILMTGHENAVFNKDAHSWLGNADTYSVAKLGAETRLRDAALLVAVQGVDTAAVLRRVDERAGELADLVNQVDENVVSALPGRTDGDVLAVLQAAFGQDRLEHLARLILGEPSA